jgi:xanthine dehydrogenase accessory factor
MRELQQELAELARKGPVGRAVVIGLKGSAPRLPGAALLVGAGGAMAGSVSGGCVESAVVSEVLEAMKAREYRVRQYGVSDEMAWSVGLACGGTIEVLIEPAVAGTVRGVLEDPAAAVVATAVGGARAIGDSWLFKEDGGEAGPGEPDEALRTAAREALRTSTSAVVAAGDASYFLEVFPRRPRLVIVGAVHVAAAMVPMAKQLGYYTIVTDGREGFLTRERFAAADAIMAGWPDQVFPAIGIDSATYICILSHDPRIDEPALDLALGSPAAYIGAIGSRKTQAARREKLAARGLSAGEIARIRGPIGLDLGGREPAETALAILAEMTMVRYGKTSAAR